MIYVKLFEQFSDDDFFIVDEHEWRNKKFDLGYEPFSDNEIESISNLVDNMTGGDIHHHKQLYCEYHIVSKVGKVIINKVNDGWFFINIDIMYSIYNKKSIELSHRLSRFLNCDDQFTREFYIKCDQLDGLLKLLYHVIDIVAME